MAESHIAEYYLRDAMNGDVVYRGSSMEEVKTSAREYDEGCEGDWLPVLYGITADGQQIPINDWDY